ncbi:enoyl-CoA hydratase [Tsuneonella sp. CC-YZS046]|uniref:enoyl-CoA hydratase n=1 Tax=Tsuneonella sp. CC-YZS046 TaxID=3042152 RepID=UPI002D794956|nr:enoyl-CoA hydratase [Tsuneonella sp. CC-YZS046]WRO65781.1 enoyl-CoA hydratase [Tsuneonella sp. CC-YZS046]
MSVLKVERDGAVAIVTLNRPEALNALSSELCIALTETIEAADRDDSVSVLVLTGAGERAFSAGVDLKELGSNPDALKAIQQYDPVRALEACRKPVLGAINGVAITGGLEVALGCDMLIGSANARFADTHARIGLLPGWGLSQRLPRMIGVHRAKQMSLTGNFLDAETALDWGIVSEVVDPDRLMARARDIARDMAGADPSFLREYKALIDRGFAMPFGEALEMERQVAWKFNGTVSHGDLEQRRAAVVQRGREQ